MRSVVLICTGLLSFVCFNMRLLRRKRISLSSHETISIQLSKNKEKLKQKRRKYKNRKYKKRSTFREKHYRLRGTKAKDSRYSNQRDIRRMHTSYS